MVVVHQCCGRCPLRAATFIIAVFYVVLSLVKIGTSVNILYIHHYNNENQSAAGDNYNRLLNTSSEEQHRNVSDTQDSDFGLKEKDVGFSSTVGEQPHKSRVPKAELIVSILLAVIECICGVLLVYGAIKKDTDVLILWVVVQSLLVIALSIMGIISCIKLNAHHEAIIALIIEIVYVVLFLLSVYFLLVVYSYYRSLHDAPRAVKLVEDTESAEV